MDRHAAMDRKPIGLAGATKTSVPHAPMETGHGPPKRGDRPRPRGDDQAAPSPEL